MTVPWAGPAAGGGVIFDLAKQRILPVCQLATLCLALFKKFLNEVSSAFSRRDATAGSPGCNAGAQIGL